LLNAPIVALIVFEVNHGEKVTDFSVRRHHRGDCSSDSAPSTMQNAIDGPFLHRAHGQLGMQQPGTPADVEIVQLLVCDGHALVSGTQRPNVLQELHAVHLAPAAADTVCQVVLQGM
jgi:hypothetical protein